ncbi:MAG: ADOP family duplicated permease [Gemmatimonadaceae bacterium]
MPRLFRLFRRAEMEQRLDEEIQFHVDMQTEKNLRLGMSPADARAAALRSFGGRDRWTEEARDEYRSRPLEDFGKDVRYAARSLRRYPLFASVVVLTLAVGIGSTSTIFSVVDAYLFRPLPFRDGERLVVLFDTQAFDERTSVSLVEFDDWRRSTRAVAQLAASFHRGMNYRGAEGAERVRVGQVTAEYFNLLGVKPVLGRGFAASEHAEGAPPVVVVSRAFWQQQLGGRPDVVGRPVVLDEQSYTVVGVVDEGLELAAERTVAWVPLERNTRWRNRGTHYLTVLGRLREGVTLDAARRDLPALAKRLRDEERRTEHGIAVTSLREHIVGSSRRSMLVMLAAVGFVLLIALANVAGLLQARAATRAHELAIRRALGAGRFRLFRQTLTEALVLAALGGAAGVLLAYGGVRLLNTRWLSSGARPVEVGVDLRVLGFALGVSVLAAVAAAVAPSAAGVYRATLRERGPAVTGSRRAVRRLLVAGEVALTMVLLVGAGLTIRSLDRLLRADFGFNPESVLTAKISLPGSRYGEDAKQRAFFGALLDRLEANPDVRAAGAVMNLPLSGGSMNGDFAIDGRPPFRAADAPAAEKHVVTPGYFRAMRIRLVRGRLFTERDRENAREVAVINEGMAKQFWPNADPIGQRIRVFGDSTTWQEIVGVVGDVRHDAVDRSATFATYVPFAQRTSPSMTLVVLSAGPTASLVAAVRDYVRALDAQLPVYGIKPLEQVVAESARSRRTPATLLGFFAGLALLLAAVGLYGLLAFSVSQRAHEMGVRMAVGADRRDVVRLVLGEGMRLVAVGGLLGVALALAVGRVLAALLYEISPLDPPTFALSAVVLAGTAAVACWAPAHRAARVDPVRVMRGE